MTELLVVMAIIGVIAAFTLPAVSSTLRGSQLDQAGKMVNSQIALARQTALAKNHGVEVRFYQYGDPDAGESAANANAGHYRALQLFEIPEGGAPLPVPLGKVMRLPSSIVMDAGTASPDSTLSSLLSAASTTSWPAVFASAQQTVSLPGPGKSYNSVAFRFLPSGGTNLPSYPVGSSAATQAWFVTLHSLVKGDKLTAPPADFFTIQINADNGHLSLFRP